MTAVRQPARLRTQIATITATRTLLNTAYRLVYPFLPTIARGLGVDVEAVALAITARSSLGLLGPAFGVIADRRGRRAGMLIGLGAAVAALLLMTLLPAYGVFFAGMLLLGAAKIVFDTSMQAYVGDRVDYRRRGLAIGVTELSWSAAYLAGIPVAGWLIARGGWNAAFPWLAALLIGCGVLLARLVSGGQGPGSQPPALPEAISILLAHRSALAALSVSLLITFANELVSIVFGVWLEDAFSLQIAALGAASIVIGVAEMGGEGLVIGVVDRLGKRRAVALGAGASVLSALALPALGSSVEGSLLGLFLFYLTFETTLVTSIALMTEIVPEHRATLLAGNVAFVSLGRALGASLGTALFAGGIAANAAASAVAYLLALGVVILFVRQE